MPTSREKRLARERQAAEFVSLNHGPLADLFEDVARDLGAEWAGLPKATLRARQAAEMAYRLDALVDLSAINPLAEALDFFGYFLVSISFLAIVDAIEGAARRRKKKITNLKERLEEKGPRMAKLAKTRLERRIKRLEEK